MTNYHRHLPSQISLERFHGSHDHRIHLNSFRRTSADSSKSFFFPPIIRLRSDFRSSFGRRAKYLNVSTESRLSWRWCRRLGRTIWQWRPRSVISTIGQRALWNPGTDRLCWPSPTAATSALSWTGRNFLSPSSNYQSFITRFYVGSPTCLSFVLSGNVYRTLRPWIRGPASFPRMMTDDPAAPVAPRISGHIDL